MPYQPLTPEQFTAAKNAGFTPDKIIAMEQQRKASQSGTTAPATPDAKPDGFLKSTAKSILGPVATILARPIQAGAELLGADSKKVDEVSNKISGGFIAPVPQNAGDVGKDIGRAAETVSLGIGGGAAATGAKGLIKEAAIQGAKSGALFGGGSALEQGKPAGEVFTDTLKGGATGGIFGGATGAISPLASKAIEKIKANRIIGASKDFDALVGKIVQGDKESIPKAKAALSNINLKGIKTYDDLHQALNDKIGTISGKLDNVLDTEPYVKPLSELSVKSKVGDAEVSHNFVQDALDQMENHYTKVNDVKGVETVKQLKQKAETQGLSIKEINNLSRQHGQDLSGFNANGELASGLSKQAAENTRKGLKETARSQFNHPVYNEADSELTKLIKTRDLAKDMADKVNTAKQKIRDRTFGEKVGSLLEKALNIGSLGTSRGILQAAGKAMGNVGNPETLNALGLEKALGKNLKLLNGILEKNLPEQQIIDKLENYLSESAGKLTKKPAVLKKKK